MCCGSKKAEAGSSVGDDYPYLAKSCAKLVDGFEAVFEPPVILFVRSDKDVARRRACGLNGGRSHYCTSHGSKYPRVICPSVTTASGSTHILFVS